MFAPSNGPTEETNPLERVPPGGAIDGRFAIQPPPPVGGAVKFLLGTEPSVEEYEETFRHGLIGPWTGWVDDNGDAVEKVSFKPDHTGETVIVSADDRLLERCIFEWQVMGEWCIRMRCVAWLAADDGAELADWDENAESVEPGDSGEDEHELSEPELGKWDTIKYEFYDSDDEEETDILLYRAGEEGFTCASRRGTGPLTADWDSIRDFMNARLLKPVEMGNDTHGGI